MNVPDSYTSPVLADKVIQDLNVKMDALTWLEYLFPLVHKGVLSDGLTYPQVYMNDGTTDNYSVLPDSYSKSYCFYEMEGRVSIDDFASEAIYPFSMTVWGRLDKMDVSKEYDYTNELIKDCLDVLKTFDCSDMSYTTDDVFDGFSGLDNINSQVEMRPFTAFKIYFTYRDTGFCL